MGLILLCKNCKKEFQITEADRDVALIDLIEQGKVGGGHVWNVRGRKYALRHPTRQELQEEKEEME